MKTTPIDPKDSAAKAQAQRAPLLTPRNPGATTPKRPSHHSSAKRTVMIVLIAVLLLLGTAAIVLAYMWYQSPERTLMAAITNTAKQQAISFDGNYSHNADTLKVVGRMNNGDTALTTDGFVTIKGNKLDVKASIISIDTTTYVKSDNLSGILTAVMPVSKNAVVQSATDVLSQKANGRWVKLEKGQLATYTGNNTSANCLMDVVQKLSGNAGARAELAKLYIEHPFIIIKSQSAKGDISAFDITIDVTKYVAFKSQLKRSQLQASLINCSDTTYLITEDQVANLKIAVTVNTKELLITSVDTTASTSSIPAISADLAYQNVKSVAAPADAISANDLQNEVIKQAIGESMFGNKIMSLFGR